MARGRRGTPVARIAVEALPIEPAIEPDINTGVGLDELNSETERHLVYAYVSLSEAMAITYGDEQLRLQEARGEVTNALALIGVDVESHPIVRDIYA